MNRVGDGFSIKSRFISSDNGFFVRDYLKKKTFF